MSPACFVAKLRRSTSAPARGRPFVGMSCMSALILIGLAACGSSHNNHATVSSQVISLVVAGNALPGPTMRADARGVLIGRCMRGEGFPFPALPPSIVPSQVLPLLLNGAVASVPSESTAIDAARRFGFGLGTSGQVPAQTSVIRQSASAQQPNEKAFLTALLGADGHDGSFKVAGIAEHTYPTQGCVATADRTLYGSPTLAMEAVYLPEDLDLEVGHDVYSDHAYRDATRRWSTCFMARTARKTNEPYAVAGELWDYAQKAAMPAPAMRAYERSVAVADVECQYNVGFISTAVRLRRQYATTVARDYAGLLTTLVGVRATATKKAGALLGEDRR